ncbi:MAG: peptidoglycan editing factor PgeF [Bacillota bacterium]|jgi:YfiH family protein
MSWRRVRQGDGDLFCATLLNQPGLIQAFSTREWGNLALHTGDHPETVVRRRQDFLAGWGLPLEKLVAANQVHGAAVRVVTAAMAGAGAREAATALPETDALITEVPGVILAIFTADCLPVFLYDPDRPAIAVIHAGWRGAIARIVERTVAAMVKQYRTTPQRLWAAIGPAICKRCFQVRPEVARRFAKADPRAVLTDTDGVYVDLAGFTARQLAGWGVAPGQIDQEAPCTACNRDTFFSYRAEGRTGGRMMGVISLRR